MECRTLDLTIKRANGLKNVNLFLPMDVYAEISIVGDPRGKSKQKTSVAKDGNTDPHWNHHMRFTIDEAAAQSNRLTLKIKLVSNRTLGDKKIGKVHVPIKQLLDESAKGGDEGKSEKTVTYSVNTASGKVKGTVEFSYKFGEKYTVQAPPQPAMKAAEPMMAHPQGYPGSSSGYSAGGAYPPPPPAGTAYPYPPQGYGYPPAPHPGYGYPPPQPGYVYPPQKPKRNGGGGGMALGLGAGLLGGLLVGDMISDAADSSYDAGYDAGFGDGFDF